MFSKYVTVDVLPLFVAVGAVRPRPRVFSNPLSSYIYDTISMHNGEITKMIVSPDNRYLFTCGQDGCIFIFRVGEQLLSVD